MTVRSCVLALLITAGLAFLGGTRFRTGVTVDARTVALQDSLTATRADYAKAQALRLAQARQDSLWVESVSRAAAQTYARARWLKAQAKTAVAKLPADTTCPDSLATVTDALAAETGRAEALDSTVTLLDSTVAVITHRSELYRAGMLAAERRLEVTDSVNIGLTKALKRARVPRVILSVGPGYSLIYSGGRLATGPGLSVGLTVPIPLPWPFR